MKHTISLTRNSRFKKVYSRGDNFADGLLALYTLKNNLDFNRLGITVSKKLGKAVVRNRVKRLIKESYYTIEKELITGQDIVVVARMRAAEAGFSEIQSSLKHLFRKGGLIQKGESV